MTRPTWIPILCLLQPAAAAVAARSLWERDSCEANFQKCAQAGLPDNFCCPAGQTCEVLAGKTTVLCCPSGSDCANIEPISCDITLQDGQKHPDAVIKTTLLNGIMSGCGEGLCCPFGYTCDSNGHSHCSKASNQDTLPFTTGLASSSLPASTATTASAKSTSNPAASNGFTTTFSYSASTTADPATASTPSDIPAGGTGAQPAVIAGAVIGAVLASILVGVIVCICLKRRRARRNGDDHSVKSMRTTSSFGNIISNPILTEQAAIRSDFARRSPRARSSTASSFASRIGAFRGSMTAQPRPLQTRAGSDNGTVPPIRKMRNSSVAYGLSPSSTSPNTSPYHNTKEFGRVPDPYTESVYPQTPKNREPSSMSIPFFTDERTLIHSRGQDSNHLATPTRQQRNSRGSTFTTFTDMLRHVALDDVAKGKAPFVPPGAYSPAPPKRPWLS